jgi:hypothetical protein
MSWLSRLQAKGQPLNSNGIHRRCQDYTRSGPVSISLGGRARERMKGRATSCPRSAATTPPAIFVRRGFVWRSREAELAAQLRSRVCGSSGRVGTWLQRRASIRFPATNGVNGPAGRDTRRWRLHREHTRRLRDAGPHDRGSRRGCRGPATLGSRRQATAAVRAAHPLTHAVFRAGPALSRDGRGELRDRSGELTRRWLYSNKARYSA